MVCKFILLVIYSRQARPDGMANFDGPLATYGNVAKPEFGPDWQLRFQLRFVFSK